MSVEIGLTDEQEPSYLKSGTRGDALELLKFLWFLLFTLSLMVVLMVLLAPAFNSPGSGKRESDKADQDKRKGFWTLAAAVFVVAVTVARALLY